MSALKGRANSEVLAGTADLSFTGPLVADGARIISKLSAEIWELRRVQPGSDAQRLERVWLQHHPVSEAKPPTSAP
jgi:hypothetical protein